MTQETIGDVYYAESMTEILEEIDNRVENACFWFLKLCIYSFDKN